jgi:energy-coupling factor transporter transmembrane protein EcfT
MRTGTPIEKLHVITKGFMILAFSVFIVYMFDIPVSKGGPDFIGLLALLFLVIGLLAISRTGKYIFTSYLVLSLPILLSQFFWWLFLSGSLPGAKMTFYLWPGVFPIGLSTVILVATFCAVYYKTRILWISILPALILWWFTVMPAVFINSSYFTWIKFSLGNSYPFLLPQWSAYIGVAKALGYAIVIYSSFLFLLTTRDVEIGGMLRQLKLSFRKAFFVMIMFRNLNTIMLDYESIRMAQVARASSVTRTGLLSKMKDLAYVSIPLVATMIRRSTEMGVALYARGFEASKGVTDYKETRRFSALDFAIIAVLVAFLIYEVVLGNSLTRLFMR